MTNRSRNIRTLIISALAIVLVGVAVGWWWSTGGWRSDALKPPRPNAPMAPRWPGGEDNDTSPGDTSTPIQDDAATSKEDTAANNQTANHQTMENEDSTTGSSSIVPESNNKLNHQTNSNNAAGEMGAPTSAKPDAEVNTNHNSSTDVSETFSYEPPMEQNFEVPEVPERLLKPSPPIADDVEMPEVGPEPSEAEAEAAETPRENEKRPQENKDANE